MTVRLDLILAHLRALVEINTTNPPRHIFADGPLVRALTDRLTGFDVKVHDFGDGCLAIDARRGTSATTFNVHMDTVPVTPGWSADPLILQCTDDRAIGLGACDIKGAAAVLLTLAEQTDLPLRFLFTTDEEAGKSASVRRYLADVDRPAKVVVAEPTLGGAVLAHRGIYSGEATFVGASGHASGDRTQNAIHRAAHWICGATTAPKLSTARINMGRIEGGIKANMIAAEARVLFGFRPAPSENIADLLQLTDDLAGDNYSRADRFIGPALPADKHGPADHAQARAAEWMAACGIVPADPVDFWTEGALFAAAGVPAVILGPGAIAQAHTANEWVRFDELCSVYTLYHRIATHADRQLP